ncbi:histone-lysine N-methyltransferase SETD1B isoform X2 [Oryzias melastigma]|uniref:histone-lysine N-methyltransferase SETD1B isoform X2 n=1 Tax=Oryzias melastigma TaxID=30732 RepID=UPI00168D11C4|nr:histone-lysine N-methyltransferase SETD1B isoform X2 [Oryzias melastigma]
MDLWEAGRKTGRAPLKAEDSECVGHLDLKRITMKSLLVLSLSLTVALGKPLLHAEQSPALTQGNLSPLLGDFVPAQGHVEVENPAPQPALTPKEGQKPPAPEDQKLTENMVELEVKVKPEVQKTKELEAAEEEEEKLVGGGIVELKLEVKPAAEGAEKEAELNVMKEEEDKTEPEKEPVESEPGLKEESEVKVDEATAAEEDQHEAQAQSEDEDDTDFKVESETKVELETQEKEEEQFESAQEKFDVQMNLDEGREQMETTEWHIDMERPPEELGHPLVESPEDDDSLEDEDDDSVLFGDQEQEDEELNNHLDASEMEPETAVEEEPDVHQMFQQNSEPLPDKDEPLVVQEPRGMDLEEEEEPEKNPQTESGKFNDFTCWTPQAFVCSYPYH